MITLRIICSVFVGISFITGLMKDSSLVDERTSNAKALLLVVYSVAWRVLLLIALWTIH